MKVIFKQNNEVKNVSLGYALNYLFPKKLAEAATPERLEALSKKQAEAAVSVKEKGQADHQQAERLDGKVVELKLSAGKSGKIHGSLTKKDLAKTLGVLKTNIELAEPIKKLGEYSVGLKFGQAKAKIKVVIKLKKE